MKISIQKILIMLINWEAISAIGTWITGIGTIAVAYLSLKKDKVKLSINNISFHERYYDYQNNKTNYYMFYKHSNSKIAVNMTITNISAIPTNINKITLSFIYNDGFINIFFPRVNILNLIIYPGESIDLFREIPKDRLSDFAKRNNEFKAIKLILSYSFSKKITKKIDRCSKEKFILLKERINNYNENEYYENFCEDFNYQNIECSK